MIFHRLLARTLLVLAFIATPALAAGINGGWLTSTGDLLLLMQAKNGKVFGVELTPDKQPSHFFLGSLADGQLTLTDSRDGSVLTATLDGNNLLDGSLAVPEQDPQAFTAKLYFSYPGGSHDGLWQIDGANRYLVYMTAKIKGVDSVLVPYLAWDEAMNFSYDFYIGQEATDAVTGAASFSGMSALNLSVLKLDFSDADNAAITLYNGKINKMTGVRVRAVKPR